MHNFNLHQAMEVKHFCDGRVLFRKGLFKKGVSRIYQSKNAQKTFATCLDNTKIKKIDENRSICKMLLTKKAKISNIVNRF